MCMLAPANGYQFGEGTEAIINGQVANVIAFDGEKIIIGISFVAEELPYYNISFVDEVGSSVNSAIMTKAGIITLPEYEMKLPEGYKFAGWTLDGGQTLLAGEYYVNDHTEFVAVLVESGVHRHVYDKNYIDNGQGFHEKRCIDIENCDDPAGSVISEMHQYENFTPCDVICTICGSERTTDTGFGYHFFEFECSEVCSVCGKQRETQHTPGEAATCGKAQLCTVCGIELAPKTDAHTPSAEPTCTEAQTCTVCGIELKAAIGHSAGVEWLYNEEGHYKLCACGEKVEKGAHADADENDVCDACGYDMSTGLSVGAIIGIVIGAVVLLGGGGAAVWFFVIKKKKG